MGFLRSLSILLVHLVLSFPAYAFSADPALLEQAVSETLDVWRDARYEQLFDRLSHRGKMSREQFIAGMRETSVRPACCWRKMEDFTILSQHRSAATVYVKIGLEGGSSQSSTRELKLSYEAGLWRMHLSDITGLAGFTAKGKRHRR